MTHCQWDRPATREGVIDYLRVVFGVPLDVAEWLVAKHDEEFSRAPYHTVTDRWIGRMIAHVERVPLPFVWVDDSI